MLIFFFFLRSEVSEPVLTVHYDAAWKGHAHSQDSSFVTVGDFFFPVAVAIAVVLVELAKERFVCVVTREENDPFVKLQNRQGP